MAYKVIKASNLTDMTNVFSILNSYLPLEGWVVLDYVPNEHIALKNSEGKVIDMIYKNAGDNVIYPVYYKDETNYNNGTPLSLTSYPTYDTFYYKNFSFIIYDNNNLFICNRILHGSANMFLTNYLVKLNSFNTQDVMYFSGATHYNNKPSYYYVTNYIGYTYAFWTFVTSLSCVDFNNNFSYMISGSSVNLQLRTNYGFKYSSNNIYSSMTTSLYNVMSTYSYSPMLTDIKFSFSRIMIQPIVYVKDFDYFKDGVLYSYPVGKLNFAVKRMDKFVDYELFEIGTNKYIAFNMSENINVDTDLHAGYVFEYDSYLEI